MHLELFKIQIMFLLKISLLMNPEKESPVKSASVNNKNTMAQLY